MAVRVPIRIEPLKGPGAPPLQAVALANTGFEARARQVLVPVRAAIALRLAPDFPEGAEEVEYEGATGARMPTVGIPDALRLRVVSPEREGPQATARAVIADVAELLLNDALLGGLEIVIVDAEQGLWCFRDEMGKRTRPSEPPQLWPPPEAP